jgi:hypothetical protein
VTRVFGVVLTAIGVVAGNTFMHSPVWEGLAWTIIIPWNFYWLVQLFRAGFRRRVGPEP